MDDPHPLGGKAAVAGRLPPETRKLILDVLKEIDRPLRDVLWMHDAEGRSVTAIALALSIPVRTVDARLVEARRKFQRGVEQLRRRSVPFAADLPLQLAVLREVDGDGPDVPFDPASDLLRQMALTLRVLNPIQLQSSLAAQDNPPDSAVRSRPRPAAHPRGPGRRT